jgi:hypothetical protein
VRGGIVCGGDAVGAFRDYFAVFCDQGCERSAATGANIFERERDGAPHKVGGHIFLKA